MKKDKEQNQDAMAVPSVKIPTQSKEKPSGKSFQERNWSRIKHGEQRSQAGMVAEEIKKTEKAMGKETE